MNDTDTFVQIFRALTGEALLDIGLIAGTALLLIVGFGRLLPWLADKFHGKPRLYLLASVPLLRMLIIALALLVIIPRVIEPTPQNMLAVLGAAGLAFGFALKEYVSSLIAGVVALHEFPYRPGDWIEVGGAYGEVKHIGMRTVEIVTQDDTVVFIPHLKIWNEQIANANDGGSHLQCAADFYLQPDHDAAAVQHLLHDVALSSPYLQLDMPVSVSVGTALGDALPHPGLPHRSSSAVPVRHGSHRSRQGRAVGPGHRCRRRARGIGRRLSAHHGRAAVLVQARVPERDAECLDATIALTSRFAPHSARAYRVSALYARLNRGLRTN